jgi:hypothetical protein
VTENLSLLEFEVEEARAKFAKDLALLRSPQTFRDFRADLKSEAQSVFQRFLDDLKARAAANPSAALAIGAGIGWRLLKHPPIATALISAGILSLWRTKTIPAGEDYLATAQQRFGEQVRDAINTAKDYAADSAVAAQEKITPYARDARERVQELASSAAEEVGENIQKTRLAAQSAEAHVRRAFGDDGARDQVLLGVAGLAVMAALGIAYQRS